VTRVVLLRLGQAALAVLLVVALCFTLIRLAPGDPFFTALDEPGLPAETRAALMRDFGYDRPIPVQFMRYLGQAARGNLGHSHTRSRPVTGVLVSAIPSSLLLMGAALLLGFGGGIALGAWQGWRAEHRLARVTDRLGLVVLSVPEFVLALLLLLVFAVRWRLFPAGGMRTEFGPRGAGGLVDLAHHLALPALTLALIVAAVVARHQRAAMRAVRDAEFIQAARAKGVGEGRLAVRHALRNALVPVITLSGVILPALFGGAVLVERVFNWPGMGYTLVEAALGRDYPLVVGGALVTSLAVVLGTLAADLATAWADPRLRREL
jgi:peptide/nickel transport system permease protein